MTYLIMGKTGTGKSYFACHLVDALRGKKSDMRKVIVVSDQEQDIELLDSISGFERFYVVDVTADNYNKIDFARLLDREDAIGFVVFNVLESEQVEFFNDLCKVIFAHGNCVLWIDEAHIFFPQWGYPIELERLVRGGRKRGVDVVLVTQQVIDLRKTALKQAHVGIFFRITEENELKKLRAMGVDADVVMNLPLYVGYIHDFITGESGLIRAEDLDIT